MYYVRLSTLLLFFLAILLFFGGLLLIPSYVFSINEIAFSKQYLIALQESVELKERSVQGKEIASLVEKQTILKEYGTPPIAPHMIETLIRAKPQEVSITAIAYTHADDVSEIVFSGSSSTRSGLVAFTENLKNSSAFLDVSLPIQSLISDEDIPFSFSVTYRHKNI